MECLFFLLDLIACPSFSLQFNSFRFRVSGRLRCSKWRRGKGLQSVLVNRIERLRDYLDLWVSERKVFVVDVALETSVVQILFAFRRNIKHSHWLSSVSP